MERNFAYSRPGYNNSNDRKEGRGSFLNFETATAISGVQTEWIR